MRVAADEGSGPVAVLLHGQPGDAEETLLLRLALRQQGLRVFAVDRPGYSGDPSSATGYDGNAVALKAMLDEVVPGEPALIVGMSWAGAVALAFALRYPERTAGLLLVSSVGAPGSVAVADRVFAARGLRRASAFAFSRLVGLLGWSSGTRFTPAARALTMRSSMQWRRNGGWRAFEVEQVAMVTGTGPLWNRLGPLDVPVTVLHGRRDRYVPVRAGRLLAGRLQSRYVEVDAGHVLHLEVPALVAQELVALAASAARGRVP